MNHYHNHIHTVCDSIMSFLVTWDVCLSGDRFRLARWQTSVLFSWRSGQIWWKPSLVLQSIYVFSNLEFIASVIYFCLSQKQVRIARSQGSRRPRLFSLNKSEVVAVTLKMFNKVHRVKLRHIILQMHKTSTSDKVLKRSFLNKP